MSRWVRATEAAKIAGISPHHLRRLTREGRIPFAARLSPRVVVYEEAGLRAWLDARKAESRRAYEAWLEREGSESRDE